MPSTPVPTLEEMLILREKLTNIQIAELYGVSPSTVKRWVKRLKIAPREPKNKDVEDKPRPVPLPVDSGISLMDQCKQILGGRMTEKTGQGYMLDGRPVSSMQIIKAAGLEMRK